MIVHVFNSSVVSGPETLVIPALPKLGEPVAVIFLAETRCGDKSSGPPAYTRGFGLEAIEIVVRSGASSPAWCTPMRSRLRLTSRRLHADGGPADR
jgi:hypothetical protein